MRSLSEIRYESGTPKSWVHRPIVIREGLCFYLNPDESLTPCEWTRQGQDAGRNTLNEKAEKRTGAKETDSHPEDDVNRLLRAKQDLDKSTKHFAGFSDYIAKATNLRGRF